MTAASLVAEGWLRSASLLVPPHARGEWLCRYRASIESVEILDERGELAGEGSACYLWVCRVAAANAASFRFESLELRRWIRSPLFLTCATSAALLLIAFVTRGFSVTRSLLHTLHNTAGGPYPDRLIANSAPIALAAVSGCIAAISRASFSVRRWRYIGFLLAKMLLLETIILALWLEGGAALRACLHFQALRVWAGGVALAIAFVGAFVWAVIWSFDDQRLRCPICLRRLVMPVRVGSWASVLEPAASEWLCDAGHGSVCMSEIEHGQSEHWTKLVA